MKNHITIEELRQMILYVAEQVMKNETLLTEIDSVIGDGDHGKGMTTGFKEVWQELSCMKFQSTEDVLVAVGNVLIDTMGGLLTESGKKGDYAGRNGGRACEEA